MLLGAIGACVFMGIAMEDIIAGLNSNIGVAGRFQTIKSSKSKCYCRLCSYARWFGKYIKNSTRICKR